MFVGTEHVLLGILRMGRGPAAEALSRSGLNLRDGHAALREIGLLGPDVVTLGQLPCSPEVEELLAIAAREADQMGSSTVDPHHLLLGILCRGASDAGRVLSLLGIGTSDIELVLKGLLGRVPEATTSNGVLPYETTEEERVPTRWNRFLHWIGTKKSG